MRPGKWELDRSHPLAQGLAFLSLLDEKAGRPVDAISNAVPTTFGATWGYDGITHSGTGKCAEWTLAPVASSDGYGLGDFTFFAMANPVAESTMRYLISQKNDALGAPYSQASLLINGAYAQANNSGRLAIGVYSGVSRGAQAHISSLLDGFHHLLVGIRKDGVHSLYFDSNLLTNEAQSNVAVDINRDGQFLAVGSQGGSTSNAFNRQIQFAGAYNRALSPAEIAILADRTDPMLGGLVREVNPVVYFDFGGASAGTDNLTATDIVIGAPVLGTPALGQAHALTATGITTSAPVIGTPALGQVHVLTASDLVAGAPVLGSPALAENLENVDILFASNIVTGAPVLGSPALTQIHALIANDLTVGAPILGNPALSDGTVQPSKRRGGGAWIPTPPKQKAKPKKPQLIDAPTQSEDERIIDIGKAFDPKPPVKPTLEVFDTPDDPSAIVVSQPEQPAPTPLVISKPEDVFDDDARRIVAQIMSDVPGMVQEEARRVAVMRMRDEDEVASLIMIFASV